MTTHELAKVLMECHDVPVVINGWRDDAGRTYEVTGVSPVGTCAFEPAKTREYKVGHCVFLDHKA